MRELAQTVGCTESMVSKIENGHVVPSLPMLQRLVEALDRDLTSFFGADPNAPGIVQRARQRPVATTDPIRQGKGVQYERLVPFGAGNLLEGNIHVIEPDGAKHDPITHQGETVGYVREHRGGGHHQPENTEASARALQPVKSNLLPKAASDNSSAAAQPLVSPSA